jgi:polyvinyl alcohol dehydrogenase (cytochrome)
VLQRRIHSRRSLGIAAPLLAAGVLGLAGCGSGSSPRGGSASPSAPSATTAASVPPTTAASTTSRGAPSNWLGYHGDQARTGAVRTGPALDPPAKAWTADLGGAVHGQAIVANGRIIAATEQNRVVALSPQTGAVLWSVSLGAPLTNVQAVAGCGDIDPLGITSTPVADTATGTVYVVGEVSTGGGLIHHQLEGLSIATGAVTISEDVDPPLPAGESAVHLLQRASLALGNGRVYVSYGGNNGDCGSYHGWIVGVAETGAPREVSFEVAADGEGGAIWESGGAPALDASGNIYVTTGNANPDPPQGGPDPKKYTESVVKLTPDLTPVASFKDTIAGGDEDLATGNPVLLPGGKVFAVGKTDVGYVLSQSSLTQLAAIKGICGSDPDGGPAYDAATDRIFIPCKGGGLQVVNLATNTLGTKLAGANGAPVLIGHTLWAVQYPDGTLSGFDAATGMRSSITPLGTTVPSFTSPSVGDGLLLVSTDHGLVAFR